MKRNPIRTAVLMTLATFLLAVWVIPVLMAVITSFKNEKEVLAFPPSIFF
ncbi:MAG: hypothetical protein RI906_1755, partial [Pseudomonadota bacterium]